ncbi:MAG: S8 family serine peptidase [Cyclobacteriaceae bacterium]
MKWWFGLVVFMVTLTTQGQRTFRQPISGEFVIKIKEQADSKPDLLSIDTLRNATKSLRAVKKSTNNRPSILDGIYRFTIDEPADINSFIDSIKSLGNVIYIEQVFNERLLAIPNDPSASLLSGDQPYLDLIKAYDAWDISKSNPGVVIAIVDTGIDPNHEDLSAKLYYNDDPINGVDDDNNGYIDDELGYDFADRDNDVTADGSTHGTRVSGIAAAATNNGIGIAGIGYEASIMSLKNFTTADTESNGSYEAIQYAADNGAAIINLSWGSTDSYSQFNQDIINYAVLEKNVLIVAAAGNDNAEDYFYPASYDNVLSVGATNLNDIKGGLSSYNDKVDLVAPGISIYSTTKDNQYARDDGTSYAAPMVAGTAALIKSAFPNLTATQIAERIRSTTDNIYDIDNNARFIGKLGSGRLNAFKAVSQGSIRSIQIVDAQFSGRWESGFYRGDTVSLTLSITNVMDPIVGMALMLDSLENGITVLSDEIRNIFLNTGDTIPISPLKFVINDETGPDQQLDIGIAAIGSNWKDQHFFRIYTAGNEHHLGGDSLKTTISSSGNIGYTDDDKSHGVGLIYRDNQLIDNLGFYMQPNDSIVYHNLPTTLSSNQLTSDFEIEQSILPKIYAQTDQSLYHEFKVTDSISNVRVEQSSYYWDSIPGLLLSYRIINNSIDTLFGVKSGLFNDWPEGSRFSMVGNTITIEQMSAVVGLRLLDSASSCSGGVIIADDTTTLTDSLLIGYLNVRSDSIGFDTDTTLSSYSGYQLDTLLPYADYSMHVLLGASSSTTSVDNVLDQLEEKLAVIKNNPFTSETVFSCEGGLVTLKPDEGISFAFFSDPIGQDTLAIGDTLIVGPLNSDTTFFFSNLDSSYAGKIQSIEIKRLTEIADFRFEKDTLFLGDDPQNKIQILDQSILPTSWKWDFGNETQATGIQNPRPTYHKAGSYQVILSITNEHGCLANDSSTLVVLERPSPPMLIDMLVCPDQVATISTGQNDTLRLYASETSIQYISSGTSIPFGQVDKDTTIYVSKYTSGLESAKVKVLLQLADVTLDFEAIPLLDSLYANYATLRTTSTPTTSSSWYINESFQSNEPYFNLNVQDSSYNVALVATTTDGCNVRVERALTFIPGPAPIMINDPICLGESVNLAPQNGDHFTFFSDSALTQPISKGKILTIDSLIRDTLIYVTNIDGILPSQAISALLSPIDFVININPSIDTLYLDEGKSIKFKSDSIANDYSWIVDSMLISHQSEPTLFFDSANVHLFELLATNAAGCIAYDSISIHIIESKPVALGLSTSSHWIYPNPAQNELHITNYKEFSRVIISDLMGRELLNEKIGPTINLISISDGIYIVSLFGDDQNISLRLVIHH